VLNIREVEEDKDYALLISTCAGAWRYLIGDTIRFTSKTLNEIVITGRTKQFLSLCGEHISQENLNHAVEMLSQKLNITIREFAVAGVKHEKGMFAHRWFLGCDSPLDAAEAAHILDENLKILNDDYRTERLHAIREVSAEVMNPSVFYGWMKHHGKLGGQHKFPRVLKNDKLDSWLTFLSKQK
jgi:hypothetical protein